MVLEAGLEMDWRFHAQQEGTRLKTTGLDLGEGTAMRVHPPPRDEVPAVPTALDWKELRSRPVITLP